MQQVVLNIYNKPSVKAVIDNALIGTSMALVPEWVIASEVFCLIFRFCKLWGQEKNKMTKDKWISFAMTQFVPFVGGGALGYLAGRYSMNQGWTKGPWGVALIGAMLGLFISKAVQYRRNRKKAGQHKKFYQSVVVAIWEDLKEDMEKPCQVISDGMDLLVNKIWGSENADWDEIEKEVQRLKEASEQKEENKNLTDTIDNEEISIDEELKQDSHLKQQAFN